jgi:carbamate kinase
VLTHVRVDEDDPAFADPTKPVGPFYSEEQAHRLESERGWRVAHEAGRGWRRVVPSPKPLEIVELAAIRTLVAAGTIAVACGGGGIPVSSRNGRLTGLDAVIDKDRASSVLAIALGAGRLVIVTDVEAVSRGWGTSAQEEVRELDVRAAEALLPELAAGSMGPKLEAALAFARATGHNALITSAAALAEALAGRAGTRVSA